MVDDQMMAVRVLAHLAAVDVHEVAARILVLGRHSLRKIVVLRLADLALRARGQDVRSHRELYALVRGRWIERLDADVGCRRQAGAEQLGDVLRRSLGGVGDGAVSRRPGLDPEADAFELVFAERLEAERHRASGDVHAAWLGRRGELEIEIAAARLAWLDAQEIAARGPRL